MRTIFAEEISNPGASDTDLTQKSAIHEPTEQESEVKFPKRIRHNGKGKVWATIYAKTKSYPLYRVTWSVRVGGKSRRMVKAFAAYADAKRHADARAKELASGSRVTALTPGQANDALAAFERLQAFYEATGQRVSLLGAVSTFADSAAKLMGHGGFSFADAIDGFLRTVATVKRMDIGQAVEQFITADAPRTKSTDGKRAQLSSKYAYNRAIMLRRFAAACPGTALADLSKEHLDLFMGSLGEIKTKSKNGRAATSPKSRNHHRAAIRQLLTWAVRKDYLPANHRLGEADGLRPEHANTSEVELYAPGEFKALLDRANKLPSPAKEGEEAEQDFRHMLPMIAIGGLAGLRTAELLRLTWEDVRKVDGHIEITSGKSKTRQRRLVEIVPALAQWLAPFNERTGKLCTLHEITWQQHFVRLCEQAQVEVKGKRMPVARKPNGLRHAFCTYHFAAHGNENSTAMQAGNSPAMIHAHYKGLATKKEAEAWFAVAPERAANVIPMAATAQK